MTPGYLDITCSLPAGLRSGIEIRPVAVTGGPALVSATTPLVYFVGGQVTPA